MNIQNTALAAVQSEAKKALPGQVVLALQGGSALTAYQGGVYQALHEAGIEPDWVIGTSSGAINAGIIAGNPPDNRLERLCICRSGSRRPIVRGSMPRQAWR